MTAKLTNDARIIVDDPIAENRECRQEEAKDTVNPQDVPGYNKGP